MRSCASSILSLSLYLASILLLFNGLNQGHAAESELEATITRFYGDVKLLRQPAKTRTGPSPHVEQGGLFYSVQDARLGVRLKAGEWIQTGKVGRVKLVYPSGNQVTITRNTKYRILQDESGRKSSIMDLLFGNIRVLIAPEKDAKPVEARSRTIVLGVRGTEFYLSSSSPTGGPEVSVIRGKVEVTIRNQQAPVQPEPTTLAAGYTLSVRTPPASEGKEPASQQPVEPLQIVRTSKTQLSDLHQLSKLPKPDLKTADLPSSALQTIAGLEERASAAVRKDLKVHEPKLFEKLKTMDPKLLNDADRLQEISVRDSYRKAPDRKPAADPVKPKASELEQDDQDIYDRYLDK